MTDHTELLPCPNPWCEQSDPRPRGGKCTINRTEWYEVSCARCGLSSARHSSRAAAIAAWNTRKSIDGGEVCETPWCEATQPAPEGQPVLALYRAWNRPDGKLMKHVVWWLEGDWRVYPFKDNRGHVDRWRPLAMA